LGSKMNGAKKPLLNFITNNMTINVNVLCPFVKNWIGSNKQCSFTITEEKCRLRMRDTEVFQQGKQPNQFTSGRHH
jgi:hypothetical protein